MPFYVEAYRPDGSQILGNGDGQAILKCKIFRNTKLYTHLIFGIPGWAVWTRPAYWLIRNEREEVVCRIPNKRHKAN